jgi:hypothetical protein
MLDILSQFDSIKIENSTRIDIEDKMYCEKHEKAYQATLNNYKGTLSNWIILHNNQIKELSYNRNGYTYTEEYISYFGGGNSICIDKIIQEIDKIKEKFIGRITNYFENKYHVTIDDNKIIEKYKNKFDYHKKENSDKTLKLDLIEYVDIDYNTILDEIFLQLNGFSFKEKAIDEIKQKARIPLHWYEYRKYWNYEVKGKIIKFKTNIDDIKPALYYFDSNETNLNNCFSYNKIDDYKSYDNGNTDIKFYNASDALDFAKRYLGYIEMTNEEREAYKKKCS